MTHRAARRQQRAHARQIHQREAVFVAAAMASRQHEFAAYLPGQTFWPEPTPTNWFGRCLVIAAVIACAWPIFHAFN